MKLATLLATLAALTTPALADATPADAGTTTATATPLHLDVEVDPTAYVFSGYSVHVGVGWRRLRLDLGTYAMDLPAFLHGNDGWSAGFDGAGAKLQWFPFADQRGGFVDAGVGVARQRVTLDATGASQRDRFATIGASVGYRFWLPYRFYATTWAGVSYNAGAQDVMLDGQTYQTASVQPFAAVHLGYRFR